MNLGAKNEKIPLIMPKERFLKIFSDFKRQIELQENTEKKKRALQWIHQVDEWFNALSNGDYEHSVEQRLHELVQHSTQSEVNSVLDRYDIIHPVYNYYQSFEENVLGPSIRIPESQFIVSKSE